MKNNQNTNSRLVYSTACGKICPDCAQPVNSCICQKAKKTAVIKTDGRIRVTLETKGRKGKAVTVIKGLAMSEQELLNLAKSLKQKFGTGGSVKDYTIELQGDFREQVIKELQLK